MTVTQQIIHVQLNFEFSFIDYGTSEFKWIIWASKLHFPIATCMLAYLGLARTWLDHNLLPSHMVDVRPSCILYARKSFTYTCQYVGKVYRNRLDGLYSFYYIVIENVVKATSVYVLK